MTCELTVFVCILGEIPKGCIDYIFLESIYRIGIMTAGQFLRRGMYRFASVPQNMIYPYLFLKFAAQGLLSGITPCSQYWHICFHICMPHLQRSEWVPKVILEERDCGSNKVCARIIHLSFAHIFYLSQINSMSSYYFIDINRWTLS